MKSINILTLLLFVCIHFCSAQDTTLVLKPTMLDQDSMQIFISDMKGWLFKQGNDTAWVRKEIDVSGWKRLMPAELSEKMVDKDGRVEGWFRIKIKPDSTFGETSFGFKISTWAASDLYIDGKWIASLGNTGLNGAPYRENRFAADLIPISVNLKPGNEYTVALHVVDYLSPLPPYNLKAKESELRSMIRVVVPKYYSTIVPEATNRIYFSIILVAISAVLSLLFWLLFFQNRNEKNLFLFSLASSILTISLIAQAVTINSGASYGGISFVWLWVFNQLEAVSFLMYFMSVPFILARIFKRRIPRIISFFFILFILFTLFVTTGNLPSIEVVKKIVQIVSLTSFLFIFSVSIYYIVSSWKTLKGAQWAIVMGLLVPLFLLVIIILATFISKSFVENNINIPVVRLK